MNLVANTRSPMFSKQSVINYLFVIIVFITTRQFPLSFLSPLMNIAVIAIIVLSLIKIKLDKYTYAIVFFLLLFPLSYNLLYSVLIGGNKLTLVMKFYLTLVCVGLAYFVQVNKSALKLFIQVCLLQVAVMFGIYFYITIFLDSNTYLALRGFFLEQGWGDVYTFDGVFYRIQIKGSALLVVAFILNIELELFKRKYLVAFFLLSGIIIAGNFAFLIALAIYFIYKAFATKQAKTVNIYLLKVGFFCFTLILASPYIFQYVSGVLEQKNDFSLGTRRDQYDVLMKSLSENPFTLLLGQGLGHTVDVITPFRDYTGNTYYEIQLLYILNQLGIIVFVLYIIYHALIITCNWRKSEFIIFLTYFVYITYAVTNPYIFDTNHFIVIIILNSWVSLKQKSAFDSNPNLRPGILI